MCRWLAYLGPPIRLGDVLARPDHSLIDQSRHARMNVETTNGDGFGVGWYAEEPEPGLYRDTYPAWNDENFRHLAAHIRSGCFLSHVRAATGTPAQKTNCHPFAFENWLFQHNGSIPEFATVKRELAFEVAEELYPHIAGSTDSEMLFFLALTYGLRDDPAAAFSRTIARVEAARRSAGIERPVFFTACATDGRRLWAVRYSSHADSQTLFHGRHLRSLRDVDGTYGPLPEGAAVLASEPLDELPSHWEEIPESSLLKVEAGHTSILPFEPAVYA